MFDLNEVLDYCIKRIKMHYPKKRIHIWGNFKQTKMSIRVDDFIFELFTNLLDNAVKYDSREQVEIGINLNKVKWKSSDYIRIDILDRGCGIPPAQRNIIFKRFKSSKPGPNSSGLGLSIVKALVLRYGGDIKIKDRVAGDYQKGTVFSIYLPNETNKNNNNSK
ncbi:MAG: HAMP domain-containing histidine kinase [Thermoplasmata archaeon]|nr:MAG: HAMP domain-containing histidine kinase [Thermoplasmata archaeon]